MRRDLLIRRASLEPTTVDEIERTVDVVWSTGAGVRRRDAAGEFEERLSLDPAHVNVAPLVGAPVLDGHRQDSVDRILGVVTAAHADGVRGMATVQFSERAEAVWRDVKAGILRSVSVGYVVQRWQDSRANGLRVRTAIAWTPKELSLVAVPADAGATTRGEPSMEVPIPTPPPDVPLRPSVPEVPVRPTTPDVPTRNEEIRRLVRAAHLEHTVADSLIDRGATLDSARAELFDMLTGTPPVTVRHQRIEMGDPLDAPEKLVQRMADALTCRLTGTAPKDDARPYMHRRVVDLAAELLEARGERTRLWAPDTILTRAGSHTSGDFPTLLVATGNRILQEAYTVAQSPVRRLARTVQVPDFRSRTLARLSEAPALLPVAEHGEITYGTRLEAKEAYKIATYGRLFSITRQALVNDDLGAFADVSRAAGRAAAELEAQTIVDLLTSNSGAGPVMDDGENLFDATAHGNVAGSGTTIDVAALSAARLALRSMKGLDGKTPIGVTPRYLLVGPARETLAEQVLATLAAATVSAVNPFSQRLELLVEPRLAGNAFHVFGDPAELPVFEAAHLSSAPGPQLAARAGWETLSQEFRITLDYGAAAIEWRAAYRNPGN